MCNQASHPTMGRGPGFRACRRQGASGFTLIELMIVIAILAVLATIAISYLYMARQRAYEITARHDLDQFIKAQEAAFTENDRFIGQAGQSLRGDPGVSDFSLPTFRISAGVVITVISGDPATPYDSANPYTAQAKHQNAPRFFEYNFATGQTIER